MIKLQELSARAWVAGCVTAVALTGATVANAVDGIHGIDLQIEEGEFVGFAGPSDCGKSTLLRLIARLDDPTSGDILIQGKRVNSVSAPERGQSIGVTFHTQDFHIFGGEGEGSLPMDR